VEVKISMLTGPKSDAPAREDTMNFTHLFGGNGGNMGILQTIGLIAIAVVGLGLAPALGAPRAIQPTGSLLVPVKCTSECVKWEWVWATNGRYKVKKCKWWVKTCTQD
jgi:hypothetical protein